MANRDKGSDNGSVMLGNNIDNRGESNDSPRGEKNMKNLMESFTKEQMYVLLGSHLRKAVEGYYRSAISLEAYERAEKCHHTRLTAKKMAKFYEVRKKGYKVAIVEQLLQILESMPKRRRTLEQAQAILDEFSDSGLNSKHCRKIDGSIFYDNIRGVRIDTDFSPTGSLEISLSEALHIDKEWEERPLGRNYASRVERMIVYVETGSF